MKKSTIEIPTKEPSKIVRYKRGILVIKPESELNKVYFLRKGLIRQFWVSAEGEEVTIHIFKPGSLFPLMLIIIKNSDSFYFEALTNVELQEFSAQESLNSIKNNPNLLYEFTEKFAFAINGLSLRIEMLAVSKVSTKILIFLDYLAKSFGTKIDDGKIEVNLNFTHNDISSWIGAQRETVSREISKLTKSGVLTFNKKGILINKDFFPTKMKNR